MLKDEFMKKIKDENIMLDRLDVVIGETTNVPFSLGCYKEGNVWKIYRIGERQNFSIIKFGKEEEIFDEMYSLIKGKIKFMQCLEKMNN
ncbi:MAG TPA: hypothetical protein VF941_19255 [Clostridia bacterium]